MKDTREIADADYAKEYVDWHIKTGGFARDKTLRDEFAGLALQEIIHEGFDLEETSNRAYKIADAMLKERAK